jgi:hypothetical protein
MAADISDIASNVASQVSGVRASAATLVLKKSFEADRDSVLTILGVSNQHSQANLSSGVGSKVDVSA